MQVFLIFFECALLGLCFGYMRAKAWNRVFRVIWVVVLALVFAGQMEHYFPKSNIAPRMTTGENYQEMTALSKWLRDNTEKDAVVLANFMVSPTIFHYGQRQIVLQPKFESGDMRNKYQQFIEALFDGKERVFYDYCLQHDVDYFVFHRGMFAGRGPGWIYSSKYISGREGSLEGTEIYKLVQNPGDLDYFFRFEDFDPKSQYMIYRVATPENIEYSQQLIHEGAAALAEYFETRERAALDTAEQRLVEATQYYPGSVEAFQKLVTVFTLQNNRRGAVFAGDRMKKLMRKAEQ